MDLSLTFLSLYDFFSKNSKKDNDICSLLALSHHKEFNIARIEIAVKVSH